METLKEKRDALQSAISEIDKILSVEEQVLTLLKGAGFETLDAFVAKVRSFNTKAAAKPVAKAVKEKPIKTGKKGKRGRKPRITAEQVAKMKALRDAGTPRQKIADEVGVSVGAIIQWEKKKFVYA